VQLRAADPLRSNHPTKLIIVEFQRWNLLVISRTYPSRSSTGFHSLPREWATAL
jgi:hypothetical protein